ncbi:MAG: ATP-binding protein [Acetobacteraceae bacterium]
MQRHRANQASIREFGPEAAAILRHPLLRAGIARTLAVHAPLTAELVLPVPRELQATISLLISGSRTDRVLILLTDRTRERAVERMRADFVANAGHELRTPLASLMGLIETLRDAAAAADPAAQRRFLAIMAEQASRMHRLIDDLLSLSYIELVEHQRPADQVDLAKLIEHIAAGFEPLILARKAALALAVEPALPLLVGDADQLVQLLQNLLDNALKYGGTGVHIRITAEPARAGERWPVQPSVVLAVSDNGPGIAREHLPRLTERFYRVDKARSRAAGSTGLGLAIIKHIVNRHRG